MGETPPLLLLCANAISRGLIHEDQYLQNIVELPLDLVDYLVMNLSALALQKLHAALFPDHCDRLEFVTDSSKDSKKRGRYGNFNAAWKILFKSRWPEGVKHTLPISCVAKEDGVARCEVTLSTGDWQQMYWEAHLQNCLDEAAETALLPSFDGCIGEITISDTIMKTVGYMESMVHRTDQYSKLSYHCQQFGCYARHLRLQNVICNAKTCELLSGNKLQGLVFRSISKNHVDGACKLLMQNSETLLWLEFIHCRLLPACWVRICDSLCMENSGRHRIQYLSIKSSAIINESNPDSLPSGLLYFLSSGRSLCSLNLSDNRVGPDFLKMIFDTLFDSSSTLSTLEISDTHVAGWLSKADGTFLCRPLRSLCVLNLRGNNLCKEDMEEFASVLVDMPNLQSLDISDNPIGDDGIRSLIPYFIEASSRTCRLSDIKMENCSLSCIGGTELFRSLSTLSKPLNALSIAENDLGSNVAGSLAKFLATSHIRVLNIEDIGLGSSGFLELETEVPSGVQLVCINVSKNRGGIETAKFVSKLILEAPQLVSINAGFNFLPAESLVMICTALTLNKGNLKRLDLTGNSRCCEPSHVSMVAEFQFHGKPIVILSQSPESAAPYDDDP